MDSIWQTAWLVVNPVMVYSYGFRFICDGSDITLNDNPDIKYSTMGGAYYLSLTGPTLAHLEAFHMLLLAVSSWCVNLINYCLCDDLLRKLGRLQAGKTCLCFNKSII